MQADLADQRREAATAALSSLRIRTVALPAGNIGAVQRFPLGTGRQTGSIGFRPDLSGSRALRRAVIYRTLLEPPRAFRAPSGLPE